MNEFIMVTGANGLIGKTLIKRLREESRQVIGIDINASKTDESIEIADLNDIHKLHALCDKYSITSIVHCGAISGPMVMLDNPYKIIEINVMGTANILEIARIRKMKRVVYCSSTTAYGPTKDLSENFAVPVNEDIPMRPSSVYGASKVASEQLLMAYQKQHHLDATAIRLSWVYGPGRTTDCIVRTMILAALNNQPLEINWGKSFPRQYIYVEDAVDALIKALDYSGKINPVYHVTGEDYSTISEIAKTVNHVLGGQTITLREGDDPLDDWQKPFDIKRIKEDLNFVPKTNLAKGIKLYADWLNSNS